jgi:hypothetical protein
MPKYFFLFFAFSLYKGNSPALIPRTAINNNTMSQHLIKEVQQLKQQVALLQENDQGELGRIWEYLREVRDRLDSIEQKLEGVRDDVGGVNIQPPNQLQKWADDDS